jgi:prevent-host-death family protein
MKRASVAELKARLSEFLAAVKRGEDVIVTDRGKPVARITGLGTGGRQRARAQELVAAGILQPPRGKLPRDFFKVPRPQDPDGRVLRALQEERSEGW